MVKQAVEHNILSINVLCYTRGRHLFRAQYNLPYLLFPSRRL